MQETEESLDERNTPDENLIDGTMEELFKKLKDYGSGRLKKEITRERARVVKTLRQKYELSFDEIADGTDHLHNSGSLGNMLRSLEESPKSPDKKAEKKAKTEIDKIIAAKITETVLTGQELGDWLTATYGPAAQLRNCPLNVLVAEAMDHFLFEKKAIEDLMGEIIGDDMYKTIMMENLVNIAAPNYVTVEKMKILNQMTELIAVLQASGCEVPESFLPAHLRALQEIEDQSNYGM